MQFKQKLYLNGVLVLNSDVFFPRYPLGDSMRTAAKEFADDPCTSAKRASMVRAARALLSSVTRLLCVADMADVYRLLASLKLVS